MRTEVVVSTINSRRLRAGLCLLLLTSCAGAAQTSPRRVILLISDGAGVEHWTLAKFARSDLAVGELPVGGLVDTRGSGHVVTGSAAGATALSTGTRTFFGAVGVGPDSTPRETVLEAAQARGMGTGVITTTWVTDATPAGFAAHVPNRNQLVDIMTQMTDLPVDVIFGGGRRVFDLAELRDSIDLRAAVTEQYAYIETAEELEQLDPSSVAQPLLGLFYPRDMARAPVRSPSLTDMMTAALGILDRDPEGFFLMVENEGSDTEAHRNIDRDVLVAEMLDFDDAVRVALEYQARHPETLIVVTADHETGGISLNPDQDRNVVIGYSTGDHTAAMVPLFAGGPGAERFGGLHENWQIGQLLMEAVGR
jgi:alkaline phosphatase